MGYNSLCADGIGGLNAKIGNENSSLKRVMGKHGCRKVNKNCDTLVDFCLDFDLVIRETYF